MTDPERRDTDDDADVSELWSQANMRRVFDPEGLRSVLGPGPPDMITPGTLRALSEEALRIFRDTEDMEKAIWHFFGDALSPYYIYGRMDSVTVQGLHLVYRLSDLIPEEARSRIPISLPDAEDGLEVSGPSLIMNKAPWYTLQDWRNAWEVMFPVIPEFQERLPFQAVLEQTTS